MMISVDDNDDIYTSQITSHSKFTVSVHVYGSSTV